MLRFLLLYLHIFAYLFIFDFYFGGLCFIALLDCYGGLCFAWLFAYFFV